MLDVWIHQIFRMEYFDGTIALLYRFSKTFEETIFLKYLIELHSSFLHSNKGQKSAESGDVCSISQVESIVPADS